LRGSFPTARDWPGHLRNPITPSLVFLIIPIAFDFFEIVFYAAECRAHVLENRMRIGEKAQVQIKSVSIRALFGQNHNEPTFGYTAKLFKSRIGVLNMLQRM